MNKMNKIKVSTNLIDQIRMSKIYKPSIYFRTLMIFFLITICPCFFLPKLTTRFCYNSSDPARVNVSLNGETIDKIFIIFLLLCFFMISIFTKSYLKNLVSNLFRYVQKLGYTISVIGVEIKIKT